jgi:hypothetical protein
MDAHAGLVSPLAVEIHGQLVRHRHHRRQRMGTSTYAAVAAFSTAWWPVSFSLFVVTKSWCV